MTVTLPQINPADVTSDDGSIWVFGYGSLVHNPNFPHDKSVCGFIHGFRRVFWQGSTDHRGTPEAPGRTVTLAPEPNSTVWGVAYRLAGSPETQRETLAYLEWREKQYDLRERVDVFTLTNSSSPSSSPAEARCHLPSLGTQSAASLDVLDNTANTSTSTAQIIATSATTTTDDSPSTVPQQQDVDDDNAGQEEEEVVVAVRGALCYIATESPANPNYLGPASLDDIAAQIASSKGPSGPNWEYLFKLAEAMRAMSQPDEELAMLEAKVREKLDALNSK